MATTWIRRSTPYAGMVSAVVALAINQITSKMAMSNGTSFYILSVYSNALAALFLFPTAYLFHRSKRPPLSFSVLWRIFFLASFGCFSDMACYAGVDYSSPTLSTAMLNLVPAFAYILAVIFRLEEVDFRRLSTIAKSLGTIVSISGAFVVTFYNGPAILNKPLTPGSLTQLYSSSTQNWVLGGFLLASAALAVASWCILQAFILKMYQAEMIVVAFYCLFVTIQSSVVTLIAERDATIWRIDTKIGLIAILYSAIINIACRLYVTAWCIWKKGPFFVALFKPLAIVVVVVIGVIFMKEALYLGSLVGAFVLVVGFYAVVWGKSKEEKINDVTESSNYQALLLQENADEV
ncbi:WAT1-related protein At3g28050-like isoform X1 [Salvia miltiorrhiza]|uniref:WAT1-related protein At3g28050-like isoform X1 n=1 Tax=Salvia miltiorrhiza TaxID=226208 RepID=UPI0025AC57F6|nr:WAT1-related protein At3g28050-like isoform X1 [Salvia miltiorrhiza]